MNKNIIGDWGAGLTDRDYGMALAALGVLEATGKQQHQASSDPQAIMASLIVEFRGGDRTVVWRGACNPVGQKVNSWRKTIHQDAQALAAGWQLLLANTDHPRKRPRLAVKAEWRRRPDLLDLETLLGWLGADDTGCQAMVLCPEEARPWECRTIWHWPLLVGVPAEAEGQQLLDYLKNIRNGWIEELGLLRPVGEAQDACDLLILPTGMAARLAEQTRLRLRASFIVCLDDPVKGSAVPDTPQARLREKMGAAGVALVGAPRNSGEFYHQLMRELSHDLPVHAALLGVGHFFLNQLSVILGEPDSLDRLRILGVAEHLDRKHELMRQEMYKRAIPHTGARIPSFGTEPEPTPATERLSDMVRNRPFVSESHDGVPQAEAIEARKVEMEKKRCIRHIQAYAWREDVGSEPAGALTPDRPNLLTVHIGPDKKPRPDPPFPEGQIDFSKGPVVVSVQLELAGGNVAAVGKEAEIKALNRSFPQLPVGETARLFQLLDRQVAAPGLAGSGQVLVSVASEDISLDEAGDSDRAFFAVRPQPGVKEVQGRIAILYQNRIVQTACLTSPVDLRGDVGEGITVAAEATIHPRLDDLAERRQFDLALIAADDLGNRLRLTVNCDGTPQEVYIDNLDNAIKNIQDTVVGTVRRAQDILALNSDEMRDILWSLANHGRGVYNGLYKVLGDKVDGSKRFQLVCRGTAYFPLEHVYSGPPPDSDLAACTVCPNAADALRRGDCGSCSDKGSQHNLCPLHFWGFSKVIERHGEVPKDRCIGSVGVERLQLASPTRCPFGPVQPVLFAASERAFAFPDGPDWRKKLVESLSRLAGGTPPVEARTWEEWRDAVGKNTPPPKVLVLLPHSDQIGINVDALEIADKKWLTKVNIRDDVVGPKETVQLLLLLGCSTAQVNGVFAPYPFLFRDSGADIVIATLEAIRGADAVPIGKHIADLLADRLPPGREIAFGELLRDLRRELLADGHPGVLGLVGFGDADWAFGG